MVKEKLNRDGRVRNSFEIVLSDLDQFSVDSIKEYGNLPIECFILKSNGYKGNNVIISSGSSHNTNYDFEGDPYEREQNEKG